MEYKFWEILVNFDIELALISLVKNVHSFLGCLVPGSIAYNYLSKYSEMIVERSPSWPSWYYKLTL